MQKKECEKLIQTGIKLYHLIADPSVNPEVYIIDGTESEAEMQSYYEKAGLSYKKEEVILGLALNGQNRQVVLIRSNGVHTAYQFFTILWHEMGHCSFRKNNPGIFLDENQNRKVFCEQKMIHGIVVKFWDEAIAQLASNVVSNHLPEEARGNFCPDEREQLKAKLNVLASFLRKVQESDILLDSPLLNMIGIPFSPYCLAIYGAESAYNAKVKEASKQLFETMFGEDNKAFCEQMKKMIDLVIEQSGQKNIFELSESMIERACAIFVTLAEILGANQQTLQLMNWSLNDILAAFTK